MAIPEPSDPFGLWARVRLLTEWPDTDEDAVRSTLVRGWTGASGAVGRTADGMEGAGRAARVAWQDAAGEAYAATVGDTRRVRSVAAQMNALARHSDMFATMVAATKTAIADNIAVNAPRYGELMRSALPDREALGQQFVATTAAGLNAMIGGNAAAIAAQGPPDDENWLERRLAEIRDGYRRLDEAGNEVGRQVDNGIGEILNGERPRDANQQWAVVNGPRPDLGTIDVAMRRAHILYGDADGKGGGHLYSSGVPNKTVFPEDWEPDDVINGIEDVAINPDEPPIYSEDSDVWIVRGARDGVGIEVLLGPDGVVRTAYPIGGEGIARNDADGEPQPLN